MIDENSEEKPVSVPLDRKTLAKDAGAIFDRQDPFMNQRDPRVPSELSLKEKFMCWTGRHEAMTFIGSAFAFAVIGGVAGYEVCEALNEGLNYYDQVSTGLWTGLSAAFGIASGLFVAGMGTEAGTSANNDNHCYTMRATHYDRLANRAEKKNAPAADVTLYRMKALHERRCRKSKYDTHRPSRYIVGPDRLPLQPNH